MTLGKRLNEDYLNAYKSKDSVRVSVLRLLKTAITNRLVELKRPGGSLDDSEIMELLLKQAKQRKDSIEQYLAAKREDLAHKEEQELAILEEYLPRPLDTEALNSALDAAISEVGATGPQDMGRVIGLIMARYKGQVDGKQVSSLAREKLTAKK